MVPPSVPSLISIGSARVFRISLPFTVTIAIAGVQGGRITIQPDVSVYFRLVDANSLEICRIEGVKVKPNTFLSPTLNVNGAYLDMANGSAATIEKIVVDAGPLGTYPSSACDP